MDYAEGLLILTFKGSPTSSPALSSQDPPSAVGSKKPRFASTLEGRALTRPAARRIRAEANILSVGRETGLRTRRSEQRKGTSCGIYAFFLGGVCTWWRSMSRGMQWKNTITRQKWQQRSRQ